MQRTNANTTVVPPSASHALDNRLMSEILNGFKEQKEVWRLLTTAIKQVHNLKPYAHKETNFDEAQEIGAFVDKMWEALTGLDHNCTRRFQAEQDLWMKHLDNEVLAARKIEYVTENRRALAEWRIAGSNGIAINVEHQLLEALDGCFTYFEVMFDLLRRFAIKMSEPAWDEFLDSACQAIAKLAAQQVAADNKSGHHRRASHAAFQLCKGAHY